MAGIGFQLKKLFGRRSVTSAVAGVFYSTFVTVGNILFIMLAMVLLNVVMNRSDPSQEIATQLFTVLLYCFAFSFIFVSGTSMLMSRYLADRIYAQEFDKILPSLYGGLALLLPVMSIAGILFLCFSTFSLPLKFLIYCVYLESGITTFLSTYVSAVKAFKAISFTFLAGMAVTVLLAFFLPRGEHLLDSMLFCILCGFFVIIAGLMLVIRHSFEPSKENVFAFLSYFPKFYKLFLINTFISLTNYLHNMLFWQVREMQYRVGGNFVCAPDYDAAVFIAILSSISVTVLFVVKTETHFYDSYRDYLANIRNGTLAHVEQCRKNMEAVLQNEITFVVEVQFIISLFAIVLCTNLLPAFGSNTQTVELIPFTIAGYFFSTIFMCIVTLLLYFENYNKALVSALIHFALILLLTVVTILLGKNFYGLSLPIASGLSLVCALKFLKQTLGRVNYKVYCNYEMFTNLS